tara:strand:+ start:84 stop:1196 length:1113 start_codon:yes stop_codon:yes gene_type:complete
MGDFPAAGISTGFVGVHDAVIDINFMATQDCKLQIKTSPTATLADEVLFFEKDITANTRFMRRLACPSFFIRMVYNNTPSSDGRIVSGIYITSQKQFAASTFLNSKIAIDDNTNLVRVGNDYNVDMVRGIHPDFKKINIQAITQAQQSSEATVGNNGQNILDIPINSPHNFYVFSAGTQDNSTGTGARSITIDYIDTNYDEQTVTKSLLGGGLQPLDINGHAITRVTVASVGTGLVNSGTIRITNSINSFTFAFMNTGDCVTHTGVYLIPRNKHLIVTDAQISLVGYPAIVRIYEYDYGGIGTRGSIGDFRMNTNGINNSNYRLNGKIDEKKMVLINVVPDVGAPTSNTNININVNCVLCPAINSFPATV